MTNEYIYTSLPICNYMCNQLSIWCCDKVLQVLNFNTQLKLFQKRNFRQWIRSRLVYNAYRHRMLHQLQVRYADMLCEKCGHRTTTMIQNRNSYLYHTSTRSCFEHTYGEVSTSRSWQSHRRHCCRISACFAICIDINTTKTITKIILYIHSKLGFIEIFLFCIMLGKRVNGLKRIDWLFCFQHNTRQTSIIRRDRAYIGRTILYAVVSPHAPQRNHMYW